MNSNLIVRYALRETLGLVILGVALFWAAGQIGWWPAWAVLAATAAWTIATAVAIFRCSPSLLAERLGPRRGAKTWDTALMSLLGLTQLARYLVAGWDQRFGWSGGFPLAVQLTGLLVCLLGYGLFAWATASNAFFSQIVRIQAERGHVVATGGPYRLVRHPGYLGAILVELAIPFLLASWWALLIDGVNVLLVILRTGLEDRTLRTDLAGYPDYARQVRYRLVPGLW